MDWAGVAGNLSSKRVCAGGYAHYSPERLSYSRVVAAVTAPDDTRDSTSCDCLVSTKTLASGMALLLAVVVRGTERTGYVFLNSPSDEVSVQQ